MLEENKAAARAAFEAWNTGELSRLDQYIAADVIHHDPERPVCVWCYLPAVFRVSDITFRIWILVPTSHEVTVLDHDRGTGGEHDYAYRPVNA